MVWLLEGCRSFGYPNQYLTDVIQNHSEYVNEFLKTVALEEKHSLRKADFVAPIDRILVKFAYSKGSNDPREPETARKNQSSPLSYFFNSDTYGEKVTLEVFQNLVEFWKTRRVTFSMLSLQRQECDADFGYDIALQGDEMDQFGNPISLVWISKTLTSLCYAIICTLARSRYGSPALVARGAHVVRPH